MLIDETWVDLSDALETLHHVTLQVDRPVRDGITKGYLTFAGERIDLMCLHDGESSGRSAYRECLERRKILCGSNYVEEALPGISGCLSDGTSVFEGEVIYLSELLATVEEKGSALSFGRLTWARDGITSNELRALRELHTFTSGVKLPEWELAMPFLSHIDGLDIIVLQTLREIAHDHDEQIMSHPALRDGITDEKRAVIASLGLIEMNLPEWVDILLDADRTVPEERAIGLPLAGRVALSVIRPGAVASEGDGPQAMEFLEHAVRNQEEFMGVAFPHNHAIALIADVNEYIGSGSPLAIMTSDYDHQGIIAHETAHAYWSFWSKWVTEGGAIFLGAISGRDYYGAPLPDEVYSCTLVESLVELEAVEREIEEEAILESRCNYTLGYGIFFELHQSLGEADFRRGFRNLYLAWRDGTYESGCADEYRTGCYLREAFADGATPEQLAVIDEIVARRYYGRMSE